MFYREEQKLHVDTDVLQIQIFSSYLNTLM